jgi:hypothetical protein
VRNIPWYVVLLAACSTTPQPVRSEAAYRAMKGLKAATEIGVTKPVYDELMQKAAAELLALKDLVNGGADSAALIHYSAAMMTYPDAGATWGEKIDAGRYDFIPAGRVFLEGKTMEISQRYKFPSTEHSYKSKNFLTMSDSVIQVMWSLAAREAAKGDSAVVPRLRAR